MRKEGRRSDSATGPAETGVMGVTQGLAGGGLSALGALGIPGGSDSKASAAMQETWLQSLSWEDPLEKEMATYSSTLAQKILWMENLVGYSPQRVGHG